MTSQNWLPNFIIAGAPKAGTSSMHGWIADHPDAFGSIEKETYFFVDPGTHMYRPEAHISGGMNAYQAQFPLLEGVQPKVVLEATPAYIYYRTALERIPNLASRPRCLFILREPAAQIYSLYRYFKGNWNWIPADMGFAEFLKTVRNGSHEFKGNELAHNALVYGAYVDYLMKWRARLGPDRMKVVTFDQMRADEKGLTQEIAAWVGLDPSFYDTYDFPRENETYVPRNKVLQRINIAVRSLLPKGGSYNALRAMYHKLNTSRPKGPDMEDQAVILELQATFSAANIRLAEEFALDLTDWAET